MSRLFTQLDYEIRHYVIENQYRFSAAKTVRNFYRYGYLKRGYTYQDVSLIISIDCSGRLAFENIQKVLNSLFSSARMNSIYTIWLAPWNSQAHHPIEIYSSMESELLKEKLPIEDSEKGNNTFFYNAVESVKLAVRKDPYAGLVIFLMDGKIDDSWEEVRNSPLSNLRLDKRLVAVVADESSIDKIEKAKIFHKTLPLNLD